MIELPFVNYILGLLIITNSAFIYSSINLMRKNEKLEDWLVDLENDLQQVENEITEADSSGGFVLMRSWNDLENDKNFSKEIRKIHKEII